MSFPPHLKLVINNPDPLSCESRLTKERQASGKDDGREIKSGKETPVLNNTAASSNLGNNFQNMEFSLTPGSCQPGAQHDRRAFTIRSIRKIIELIESGKTVGMNLSKEQKRRKLVKCIDEDHDNAAGRKYAYQLKQASHRTEDECDSFHQDLMQSLEEIQE